MGVITLWVIAEQLHGADRMLEFRQLEVRPGTGGFRGFLIVGQQHQLVDIHMIHPLVYRGRQSLIAFVIQRLLGQLGEQRIESRSVAPARLLLLQACGTLGDWSSDVCSSDLWGSSRIE